jgi:hypothetical protein
MMNFSKDLSPHETYKYQIFDTQERKFRGPVFTKYEKAWECRETEFKDWDNLIVARITTKIEFSYWVR